MFGDTSCAGILFGANLLPKSYKKSTTSDQGCPRGDPNQCKGVPPRGSEKQVAKKHARVGMSKKLAPKWGPKSVHVDYFDNSF